MFVYRNNLYQPNVGTTQSMHQFYQSHGPHGIRQQSNVEISGDVRGGGGMSVSEDTESCGKQTVWNKIRGFFEIFKRDKSQHQRHNPIGSLKLDDLKVHGLKNTKKTNISGFSENVLNVDMEFSNLKLTSKYEMSNWGKSSSHKVSGNGQMEMTLKNVKVKISMGIIEDPVDDGQKRMKAISPKIEIKMRR
jgi:hypothetical protein